MQPLLWPIIAPRFTHYVDFSARQFVSHPRQATIPLFVRLVRKVAGNDAMGNTIERSWWQIRKRIHPLPQEVVEVEISNDEAVHLRSSWDWSGAQRINDQSAPSKVGPVFINIFVLKRVLSIFFRK
jgi:hypothetical protein